MSTCPKCHGHLTDSHKCPRTRRSVIIELGLTALTGGVIAISTIAIFDPGQTTTDLDLLVFLLGALCALGVHQIFTWRRGTRS
jgi:hypothetical protein